MTRSRNVFVEWKHNGIEFCDSAAFRVNIDPRVQEAAIVLQIELSHILRHLKMEPRFQSPYLFHVDGVLINGFEQNVVHDKPSFLF